MHLEDRLPDMIAGLKPDLIVFTGDAANSTEGIEVFRRLMTHLAAIAPTYAVRGNWEWEHFPDVDFYKGTGARTEGRSVAADGPRYEALPGRRGLAGLGVGDPPSMRASRRAR